MKITFLAASAHLGGAERVLLDLLAVLRAIRPHWMLTLCAPANGPLTSRAQALGVRVIVVPYPPRFRSAGRFSNGRISAAAAAPSAIAYALRLRKVLHHLDPDVLHSNGFKAHVTAAWAKPKRPRLLWHLHDYVGRSARLAAALRCSVGACRAIVANSHSVAADAQEVLAARRPPHVIRNGVDLHTFTPIGPECDIDAMAGLPPSAPGTVRAGLVATYARWKGHRTFLRALARLAPDLRFRGYLIGGPIYDTAGSQITRAQLERDAHELNLRSRVGFVDFVDDPAAIFRSLDIVVHASTEPEPFGLVIAEGMACGKATIASDAGAVGEILRPGVNGWLHRPGDAEDLAAAMRTLALDPALRGRLGCQARLSAERCLNRDRVAEEFCRIYEAILESSATVSSADRAIA